QTSFTLPEPVPFRSKLLKIDRALDPPRKRERGMASLWERFSSAIRQLRGYATFWLHAFSQPTIDLSLRTHEGLTTRIVESPGKSLSEDELERLVAQLRVVAGKTLPAGGLTYGIFSGER